MYKELGIGLGFEFDHMSYLNATQTPSARRLQARAAKSAVRRAQVIRSNFTRAREELDSIADPEARERRSLQLQRQADEEIRYLASRLSELVPTDLSLGVEEADRIEQYSRRNPPRYDVQLPSQGSSIRGHTLLSQILHDENMRREGDLAAKTGRNFNATGNNATSVPATAEDSAAAAAAAVDDDDDDDDAAFVREWARRRYYGGDYTASRGGYDLPAEAAQRTGSDSVNDDDDDDDDDITPMETALA